ncbi:MAG: MarR family transcriptional regulator [Fluviicola sp.]|nr:MAG: MarR family transcriptional regulator [Fluviicola sp.]
MKIEEVIKAKFKGEHHKAVVNIRYTSNWIGAYHNKQLAEFDLSLPQFNILRILRGANEPLSIKIVKQRMLEKSPNTTRLIDKLISKEMVKRSRCDDDRRVVHIEITKKGLSILSEIDEVFDDMSLAENLTNDEASLLNVLLNKLRGK